MFSALAGNFLRGIGQDEDELFTPITTGNVCYAGVLLQKTAQSSQQLVATRMPVGIIEPLEVIDVQHDNAERKLFARGPIQFADQCLFHISPVEQPGQRIADGLFAQQRFTLTELERFFVGKN